MPLILVATPIGHPEDMTLRGLKAIETADVLVCEEIKEGRRLLSRLKIPQRELLVLNEHSLAEDIAEICELAKNSIVVLFSDCGTPNFCDPGATLVHQCREKNIKVESLPGASSLMTLLSLTSVRLHDFVFCGFLPAKSESRIKALNKLKGETRAMILLDTPYRLSKLVQELANSFPHRRALLGINLTSPDQRVLEGKMTQLVSQVQGLKAEFIILIYPK